MKSLSKRTKNESFIDDADASIELGRPPALVKSSRYISLWQSNLVQVDVSHFRSLGTKFYEYDLDSIVIWCGGGHGSIYDGTKPLSDFPNFQEALKFSINETLKKHKTHLRDKLASTIRICTHFFGWLVQRGIYLLSDCSRADIDNLIRDVASHSWNGVADLRRRLQQLARDLARKPEIAVSLASSANYGVLTINIQQLERTLGVPVGGNDIPNWFRRRVARLTNYPRDWRATFTPYAASHSEVKRTMQVLNHLSRAPKPIDTIPFLAFVAPNGDASKLIEEPNSQTPNITPTESVRLLTECLKWLFEYGPRIVTLVEQARSTLLSAPPGTAPKETNKKIKNLIRAEIDQLVSSGQIPGSGTINEKEPGLQHLVGLSMCAAGCIIAIIGLTQKKLSNSREFLVDYSTPEVMQAIGSD